MGQNNWNFKKKIILLLMHLIKIALVIKILFYMIAILESLAQL